MAARSLSEAPVDSSGDLRPIGRFERCALELLRGPSETDGGDPPAGPSGDIVTLTWRGLAVATAVVVVALIAALVTVVLRRQ